MCDIELAVLWQPGSALTKDRSRWPNFRTFRRHQTARQPQSSKHYPASRSMLANASSTARLTSWPGTGGRARSSANQLDGQPPRPASTQKGLEAQSKRPTWLAEAPNNPQPFSKRTHILSAAPALVMAVAIDPQHVRSLKDGRTWERCQRQQICRRLSSTIPNQDPKFMFS